MRRKFKQKFKRKYYRLNWNINAPKLRVIDKEGKQVGVLTKDEALKLAKEQEIDLIEIAPKASPPVCKLIDFKKFLYLEKKKERDKKKGNKKGTKEIRIRPFIAKHDYEVRLAQTKEFLSDGEKIRVRVRFFGREIAKKKFGFDIIDRLLKDLGEGVNVEREPRFVGKTLVAQLAPEKNYGKKTKKTKSQDQKDRPKTIQNNQNRKSASPGSNDSPSKSKQKQITNPPTKKNKKS